MTSYILLTLLVIIIILGIIRATKKPKGNRRNKFHFQESLIQGQTIDAELVNVNDTPSIDNREHILSPAPSISMASSPAIPSAENIPPETPVKPRKNELITITLRAAKDKPYKGYELLQALLTSGLRYNRTGVFHRYQKLINRDEILFSLISAIAPGTFELPKMGTFSSPALTLFMETAAVQHPLQVYDMMLATGQELIEILGGQLLDQTRTPLTPEKIAQRRVQLGDSAPLIV